MLLSQAPEIDISNSPAGTTPLSDLLLIPLRPAEESPTSSAAPTPPALPVLHLSECFPYRPTALQWVSGLLCADGTVSIVQGNNQGNLTAMLIFYQSNTALLNAINEFFGHKGHVKTSYASECPSNNVAVEGKYSKGEKRQFLTFRSKAAGEIAQELLPYTVTKGPLLEIVLKFVSLPVGPSETKIALYKKAKKLNEKKTEKTSVQAANIVPAWVGGFVDGDGCICVYHDVRNGRSCLQINVTQNKSPQLLKAIQAIYPGHICSNTKLFWRTAKQIPAIYNVLSKYLLLKKQKLDTLLQYMFGVDISRDPIKGKGVGGAFTCTSPAEGWTAVSWTDYLPDHEELLPWSR